jgi:hypothetical protein
MKHEDEDEAQETGTGKTARRALFGLAAMAAGHCGLAPVAHARREKRG